MAITDKNKSTFERLQELKQLYDAGILTKEEMEAEKADILGQEKPKNEEKEQPVKSPKVVFVGTDSTNNKAKASLQPGGNTHNKRLFIISAVALVAVIAAIISLSTCHGESTAEAVAVDSAYTDTAVVASAATTEYYTGMQAVLETALAEKPIFTDFFAIPEISEAIQNEYGREFYEFFMKKIAPCKDSDIGLYKSEGDYYEETTYSTAMEINGDMDNMVLFSYNVGRDLIELSLTLDGSKVNPDGTFALAEGCKWKLTYENDEFGDPIHDKPYIYVEDGSDYLSYHLYMTVSRENENQIEFYYELPWSDIHDVNKLTAIKIKDKNDDSVYSVSNCHYFKDHCILPEEDSRYIRQLCDSNPSTSFSIRFEIKSYDLLMDNEENAVVFDFDNGRAYGLSNALNHYFHKAF